MVPPAVEAQQDSPIRANNLSEVRMCWRDLWKSK